MINNISFPIVWADFEISKTIAIDAMIYRIGLAGNVTQNPVWKTLESEMIIGSSQSEVLRVGKIKNEVISSLSIAKSFERERRWALKNNGTIETSRTPV